MKVLMMMGMILAVSGVLTGCSTSQRDLLPTGDATMKDIWNKGGGDNRNISAYRTSDGRLIDAPNYVSSREQQTYTRTAENEVKNLFPRLPNPDLVMYVYPHLTDSSEQMPVPGYSSVIPFYGRVQYAQPGERTRMY
ncbi:conjugal transfer protein [Rodentibacter mrazii]|uniref:Conjugal transfer protein n=1 Tax=Rodentibacter mrazii TaxID=1908257 RepID=A0A1V3IFP9_9PAST|nr:TIGR03751 family conjugal transfer lipoprotein [Rodentibacter mrazii]OOF39172.1 conjugal transfer protein [Rodentibacter mrazii]